MTRLPEKTSTVHLIHSELDRRAATQRPARPYFTSILSIVTLGAVLWGAWEIRSLGESLETQGPIIAEGFETINDTNEVVHILADQHKAEPDSLVLSAETVAAQVVAVLKGHP